jgi:nucleotide-binding universal stress UspA family protein
MTRIHTVLAATDLSAPARHAVERAAMVAADSGARLAVTHVVSRNALDELRHLLGQAPEAIEERLIDEARDAVRALAVDVGARLGVTADVRVAAGQVLGEIVAHADVIDAGLLVMGARGAGFMRELLLGSTTERVLRKSTRPLLVVKQIPHEPYLRVLVPVDFSPHSLAAIGLARAVAPRAELVLVHAFEVPFEGKLRFAGVEDDAIHGYRVAARRTATDRMNGLIADAGLPDGSVRWVIVHGDPSSRILEQEQEQDCDLIVVGKRGRSVLEELLLGSVTKHVLAQSAADVLVADRPA